MVTATQVDPWRKSLEHGGSRNSANVLLIDRAGFALVVLMQSESPSESPSELPGLPPRL